MTHDAVASHPPVRHGVDRDTSRSRNNNNSSSSSSSSSSGSSNHSSNSSGSRRSRRGRVSWTYVPVRLIGEGTFGVVIQARVQETGEDVAIKRVRYDGRLHNRELVIMRDVLSPPRRRGGVDGEDRTGSNSSNSSSSDDGSVTARRQHEQQQKQQEQQQQQHEQQQQQHEQHVLAVHHPNVVQLRTHYFTVDEDTGEQFLHLVMSYLPMDLQAAKRRSWAALACVPPPPPPASAHTRATTTTTAAAATTGDDVGDHAATTAPATTPPPRQTPLSMSQQLLWARVVLFQLARALAFLHAHHVCHRDVKPANVLLNPRSGRVQLGDYGSAKLIHPRGRERNVSYICSRYYRAPELLCGALHYGSEVDVWSLGCIAVELLRPRGEVLFRGATTVDQMAEVFKVLGAPSTHEMYAMNPQCAAAMLHTHHMLYPYSNAGTTAAATTTATTAATTATTTTDVTAATRAAPHASGHVGVPPHGTLEDGDGEQDALPVTHPAVAAAAATAPSLPSATSARMQSNDDDDDDDDNDVHGRSDYFDYYDVLKIRAMRWTDVLGRDVPAEAVDLVSRLLCYTPAKRLTAAAVVEHAFFHPLFTATSSSSSTSSSSHAATSEALRLPSGALLPAEMFTLTATEMRLYSRDMCAKMAREAALLRRLHNDDSDNNNTVHTS